MEMKIAEIGNKRKLLSELNVVRAPGSGEL